MKKWSTPSFAKLYARIFSVFLLACISLLTTFHSGCKSRSVPSTAAEHPSENSLPSHNSGGNPPAAPLVCPLLDFSGRPLSAQSSGGHRVILSWKVSAPPDSKHDAAVGYCIYRGDSPNGAPERVNILAFHGASCMDDLVENGKTYYYVVRAISARGVTSIVSKPAPATIPSTPENLPTTAESAPLCRQPR